ncbi:MAG: HupE/UreJ family protein [Pseudomonadota bacterium]
MASAYVMTRPADNGAGSGFEWRGAKRHMAALSVVFAMVLATLTGANGHELRPTIVDMTVEDGRVVLDMETNLEAWLADIGNAHDNSDDAPQSEVYDRLRALSPEGLTAEFASQQDIFAQGVELTIGGEMVSLGVANVDVPAAPDQALARDSMVRLVSAGQVDATAETIIKFAERFPETIIRVNGPDGTTVYSEFLSAGLATAPFTLADPEPQSAVSVFLDYIGVGFEHIVPLGLDHIIFVIGLFLLSPRLKPLLLQVTAFTLAHTITLALGATGVISITPWIVESIIALSIVYVAVENIFLRGFATHRVALVFAFGLLHGLGFAGVLGEFGLPEGSFVPALIGFNVGVELGQLSVIAACLALTFAIRDKPWYRSVVTIPVSLVIALIGAYWVLERTGILPESMGGLI